ncbi:carboxymuconolactone decarboxylase [Pelomonas sp. KK5]|uniref:carboxymuconolactone decarboxylase family protein n=1 Tax=Pelomonas sp. KK5 TaxID=1855730 RepID=UPI00097C3667
MDRLPPLGPDQWTPEQRKAAEEIIAGPRGGLIAPFVPLLRSPELMGHAQRMGEYLRYRNSLGLRFSELAILITARHWSQQVEWGIHAPIALREGVSAASVEAIAAGRRPEGMDGDESAVHDFCIELLREKAVSDSGWAAVVERFGDRGAIDLIGINGYYGFLAMVMNAAQTAAPHCEMPPLPTKGSDEAA